MSVTADLRHRWAMSDGVLVMLLGDGVGRLLITFSIRAPVGSGFDEQNMHWGTALSKARLRPTFAPQ